MKLYRTTFLDDATGSVLRSWTGTQADAAKDRKRLKTEQFRNIETKEVNVPTYKVGLLDFLRNGGGAL